MPDITPRTILAAVCDLARVSPEDVMSRKRHREIVTARAAYSAACRQLTHASFPVIADAIGKDHSTIIYASRRAERDERAKGIVRMVSEFVTATDARAHAARDRREVLAAIARHGRDESASLKGER